MKERPIIFSVDMVKAILDGRKTMTRRICKQANDWQQHYDHSWVKFNPKYNWWEFKGRSRLSDQIETFVLKCPYGQVGDRLWVREPFYVLDTLKPEFAEVFGRVVYKADHPEFGRRITGWKPSIFMPRWASRLTLEITEVRVERLQEITEEDAKLEGTNPFLVDKLSGGKHYRILKTYHHECYPLVSHANEGEEVVFECPNMGFARLHHTQWQEKQEPVFRIPAQEVFEYVGALEPNYKNGFRILWDSLNAKRGYGWEKNPWVGVIRFDNIGVRVK